MNTEDFMDTVKTVNEYAPKTGFITCSFCNSKVTTSQKPYGGMLRIVCSNDECQESEQKAFN